MHPEAKKALGLVAEFITRNTEESRLALADMLGEAGEDGAGAALRNGDEVAWVAAREQSYLESALEAIDEGRGADVQLTRVYGGEPALAAYFNGLVDGINAVDCNAHFVAARAAGFRDGLAQYLGQAEEG
jgi:hypothetical protein